MSEQSQSPEKTPLRDRIDAVMFTLHANPTAKVDAFIASDSAAGTITHQLAGKKHDSQKVLEHIPFHSLIEGKRAILLGGLGVAFGLYGRALSQARYAPDAVTGKEIAKDMLRSAYNDSLIGYIKRAWKTGVLQLPAADAPPLIHTKELENATRQAKQTAAAIRRIVRKIQPYRGKHQ